MSVWRLIIRSFFFHWRINLSVALGVMAATAVLTGALLVGDSMQGSLKYLALNRLGKIDEVLTAGRFFRAELASELAAHQGFKENYQETLPMILLRSTIENPDPEKRKRAGRVTTIGSDKRFWTLGEGGPDQDKLPQNDEIILNQPLADEIDVQLGDEVILRVPQVSQVPADSPLGRKSENIRSRRLRVCEIIPAAGLGIFSLRSSQQMPRNAFVSTKTLQSMLQQDGKVNAIIVAGKSWETPAGEQASQSLHQSLKPTLADYGLIVEHVRQEYEGQVLWDYYHLTCDRMILPKVVENAALEVFSAVGAQPILTYLANYITSGDGQAKIPYSTVTAVDSVEKRGPLLDSFGKPISLAEDELVLNSWAADDMAQQGVKVQPGDPIQLTFFEPESTHGIAKQQTHTFRLKAIVPLAGPEERPELANDKNLTPEVSGVTDQASINDWDPPFPYDSKRVRTQPPKDQDEDYWKKYRTTPKAFISLATGQRIWKSRFGQTTSIRIPASEGLDRQTIAQQLLARIDPVDLSFTFLPVKRSGLQAAQGTTSFSGLFLGFSFFIIAAAIMLVVLLFRLGIEQRSEQIGLLSAVGLRRRRIGVLLAIEGFLVATGGGLLGVGLGISYAWLMLTGLNTLWKSAVVTSFLQLHLDQPMSLAIGYAIGVGASLPAIVWTLRQLRPLTIRQLMSGRPLDSGPSSLLRKRRILLYVAILLVMAVLLAGSATQLAGEAAAGAFFGSGSLVLIACLLAIQQQLCTGTKSHTGSRFSFSLVQLAWRNIGRHPSRSTLTIGLVASASFLIVAISAFRLNPTTQGSGGFNLMAESDQPIFFDLNTKQGRNSLDILAGESAELDRSTVLSLRAQPGDDASCLNLYKPKQPRILGVTPEMIQHFSEPEIEQFAWAEHAAEDSRDQANPWRLLDQEQEDGTIPVVLDKNTAMYSMHLFTVKGSGTTFEIEDDRGRKFRLKIVGLLANSVFQGNLLISESHFKDLFPEINGYRLFLLKSSPDSADKLVNFLENKLSDQGFDIFDAREYLESLLAVQNTYLSTFQSLGALGLLLGTIGLATVQLRNVFERRGELALLRSVGLQRRCLAQMVLLENTLLLVGGLFTGVFAALVGVLPHWLTGEASVPFMALATMLAVILAVGMLSGLSAVRATLKSPLLSALRGE